MAGIRDVVRGISNLSFHSIVSYGKFHRNF